MWQLWLPTIGANFYVKIAKSTNKEREDKIIILLMMCHFKQP